MVGLSFCGVLIFCAALERVIIMHTCLSSSFLTNGMGSEDVHTFTNHVPPPKSDSCSFSRESELLD